MMKPTLPLALILALMPMGLAQDAQSVVPPKPAQNAEQATQASGLASVARPGAQEGATEPARLKVILLKPSIRFKDVHAGVRNALGIATPAANNQKRAPGSEEVYEHLMLNAARLGVGSKAIPLDPDTLEPSVVEACTKLDPLASRLARGNVNEEAMSALASLAALDEHYAILVQFFRLETGPGRSWDPNTGAITSSTDSTLIQSALVSGKTGKVIWKGERLIRNKALKPTDSGLSKALTELYRDFDIK